MHLYRPFIITVALLFTLCLFSACTSQPGPANQTSQVPTPNATPKADVGIEPVNITQGQHSVSFNDAKRNLKNSEALSLNQYQNETKVLFIQGGNVDASGNAERWIFGISKGDINELRVYDHSGWTIIPWNYTISADQIDPDLIIPPAILFEDNKYQILGSSSPAIPVQRDLELRNGTYTITITSGSTPEILMYNATTGAAIENHA